MEVNNRKIENEDPKEGKIQNLDNIETTEDIDIPHDPLLRVIGQDEAVGLAYVAAIQRRHILLVGPPGTGKSEALCTCCDTRQTRLGLPGGR